MSEVKPWILGYTVRVPIALYRNDELRAATLGTDVLEPMLEHYARERGFTLIPDSPRTTTVHFVTFERIEDPEEPDGWAYIEVTSTIEDAEVALVLYEAAALPKEIA